MPRKATVDRLIQKAAKTKRHADIKAAADANPFQPLKTTNSRRVIDIDPMITKEIIDYLAYQDAYASKHSNFKNEWNILFTTGIGTPIDEKNFRTRYFDKILKESGIQKPLSLHKMRHTHASILLKHGIDISVVSRRLGHANPTITYNIYVHVLPESMAEAGKVWSEIMTKKAS
ncbi:MAG: tyrosine-type recombinase/integrase [Phascolarctobacterium sp.]|nr:tyrosine-type recombinase/integrase [Candidatus Phascolarctobacterium caballi]